MVAFGCKMHVRENLYVVEFTVTERSSLAKSAGEPILPFSTIE